MKETESWPLRILAVDDEQSMLDTYYQILCSRTRLAGAASEMKDLGATLFGETAPKPMTAGFDVVLCQQGDEAVEAVRAAVEEDKSFAVAFVDVRLPPGPDGVWTAEQVRSLDPSMQIVLVSAYSDVNPSEIACRILPEDKLFYAQKPLFCREIRQFASALGAKWEAERLLRQAYVEIEEQIQDRTAELGILNEELKHEIVKHKQAEAALEESEKKFRELYEDAPMAYFTVRTDNRISDCNRMAMGLTGHTKKELIGKNVFDLFSDTPDGKQKASKVFHSRARAGEIHHEKIQMIKKDGSLIWGSFTLKSIRDRSGDLVAYRFMVSDITKRIKLEDQFQQAQKMEAIGTLAGGIAHDFNNILSAIIGYTEMSMQDAPEHSPLQRDLEEVLKAGTRAKDLVKQILTFSRQNKEDLKAVQVKLIVKEALKLLRASLPTTIEIRQYIQSDALVLADPTHIHQVLMNLCTNAGHAMQENDGVLEVSLTDEELDADFVTQYHDASPGRYLKLTVSDTGHGMDRSTLDRIFDPYFTTKVTGEGTGLGLAVVEGILKNHGGMIKVHSEPGKGSTFHVYLPVFKTEKELEFKPETSLPSGSETILFVDDELPLVNLGRQMMEKLGYSVVTRTSGIEALELFKVRSDQFDVVITDMTMPSMTGDRLAQEIMHIRPDIPVILCTGFSTRITEDKAKALGIRALVMKPFLKRHIAETIRKVLDEQTGAGL